MSDLWTYISRPFRGGPRVPRVSADRIDGPYPNYLAIFRAGLVLGANLSPEQRHSVLTAPSLGEAARRAGIPDHGTIHTAYEDALRLVGGSP